MFNSQYSRSARLSRWLVIIVLLAMSLAVLPPAVGLAAPAAPMQGGATCVTIQPGPSSGKDAYIKQERPDERRGGDSELRVKTENGRLMRSLLQFDLSALPPTATIVSATLSLFVKDASGGPVTINAHRVTASWNEAEVTWKARDKAANLLWATQGGDYDPSVAGSASVDDTKNVWRSWNITGLVSGWFSNPASNLGLILESPVTNPKTEKKFKSSDDGTASQRPKLVVCYSTGVILDPDNSGEGVAGQTRTYAHMLHVGSITSIINLTAVSNQGWTTRIYEDNAPVGIKGPEDVLIAQTPTLGPNVDYPILVQVDVPVVPIGTVDVTTVTATAQTGGASDTATDTTRVGSLLIVQPDHGQYATAGSVLFYGHTVTNNGQAQDCVTVTATSNHGWTVLLWEDTNQNGVHETSNPNEPSLTNPVCINPGATYYLVAELHVPAGATAGTVDQTVVTAVSGNEPSKSDSATDTTTVFVDVTPVVDGKYDDAYRMSPYAREICYTANGVLFGKLATFYQPTGNAVYMVLAIDKDFVDNTYGVNAIGWPSGHTFGNLVGSDHAQFWGYDANDAKVLDFDLDYLTSKSGTPSGYASLGVNGGDGGMNLGSATHILQWGTSLEYSLNSTGYCASGNCSAGGTNLLVDSPATDDFYTPNPTYPAWIYDVIYEVKVDKAAFGAAGFGSIEVPYIHASPSKIGTNTIYAEPGVCPGEIGDFVWYDSDHDGVQDAGEPGINGVQVKLYRDNGDGLFNPASDAVVGTQTTASGGKYLFQNLPPDDYFVDVVDATVPAGYIITTHNDPTPIINLAEGQSYLLADFGYTEPYADLQVSKTLTSEDPSWVGQEISYTIRVTNTGSTIITQLPLRDWYDTDDVDYLGATPPSDDNVDDGMLNWSDLTASFGRDLRPGETFEVVVRFRAVQATKLLLAAAAAAPQTEPLVDGRLDSNYTYLTHISTSSGSSGGNLFGYQGATMCYWAYVTDRAFNDNVYADSDAAYLALDSWTGAAHKFSSLLGSDNVVFDIAYPGGQWNNVTLDYLNGTAGNWSSGQTGKDGSPAPGTAPIADAMTSLHWNLLNSGWSSLTHSPAYNYNQTSGHYWEWGMIYEFSIPKSRMNGQCGTVTLDSQHNSPSKYDSSKGRIGDRVWDDADGDTIQDAGEVGLPNVTVNLYQGSTLVRTTQTEPGTSGYYIFVNLAAGTYRVDVDESTLPTNYMLTTNNEPMNVTIAGGGSFLTADFGYWLAGHGSIGDRVFYDANGDGLPDNDGEPGINGVTVRLYEGSACTGTPKKTAVTAGNGDYGFINLLAGTYCVDVDESTLPAGYVLTTANEPLTVILADGQNYNTADFGYRALCVDGSPNLALISGARDDLGTTLPDYQDYACVIIGPARGAIGDLVWNDANGNQIPDLYDADGDGTPDTPEPGMENVVVGLTLPGGGVITTTTTITGFYQFVHLPAGHYVVDVVSVEDGYYPTTNNHPHPVDLGQGQIYSDADFGYAGKGNILGVIFYDWDTDGQQNLVINETGIGSVEVCLYSDHDPIGVFDPSDVFQECGYTDSSGNYLFADYLPGRYLVVQTQPAGLQSTTPNVRALALIVVGFSGSAPGNDFGEVVYDRAGDFAWVDSNGNGAQDPGETIGLYGVPIRITGTNVMGVSVDITVTTTITGYYIAGDLLPGTYTASAPPAFGNYVRTSPGSLTTTLTVSDTEDLGLDFGYLAPTGFWLTRFDANAGVNQVQLTWTVQLNGAGAPQFHVWRATVGGPWKQLTQDWVTATDNDGQAAGYSFTDMAVEAGVTYQYSLIGEGGEIVGPVQVTVPAANPTGGRRFYVPFVIR